MDLCGAEAAQTKFTEAEEGSGEGIDDHSANILQHFSKADKHPVVIPDVRETKKENAWEDEEAFMISVDASFSESLDTDDELAVSSVVSSILSRVCSSELDQNRRERRVLQGELQVTQNLDSDSNVTVAAILSKLNDPQKRLNRRERRALQRELEMAQGIQKIYSASQPCPNQPSLAGDSSPHCSLPENESHALTKSLSSPASALYKCASSPPVCDNVAVHKGSRAQQSVPAVRESVFRLDSVPMTPHDCAVTAFNCARISYISTAVPVNNFLKLCRFSPSGTYIGTTSADNWARIFGLDDEHKLSLVAKIPLGDATYDIKWLFNGCEKQLLATTAKHHPIHLWTEYGMRYSSYRGINHLDELTAAYSIAFSNDGTRLYGGYNSCIRIWDTDRPGRQHTSIKTYEKQTGGQKSIVSCIAMNKAFDGVYAAGSYDGNVGFYSDRTNSLECMFSTESAGITDMHYSYDGQRLFIATRKKNEISCYDMRMPGNLLFNMLRPFTTNQRACFEVDSAGHYLFSGTSEGDLAAFDLACGATEKVPAFSRKVAECSVPCVSIYEGKPPMVALCTGERVFPAPRVGRTSPSDSDSDDNETSYRRRCFDKDLNNSLQLWCF